MEGSRELQSGAGGPVAGSSAALPAPVKPQVHSVTANNGNISIAGRDVNVNNVNITHNHYPSYPDKVDITAVLSGIRNLRTIHSDNLSKATPGTGVWFFKTNMFLMWLDLNGHLKILWGSGIPGAGKTVLTSIVIQELEARAKVPGSRICVCYVYCRYSDNANLTVRNVLEILVKQSVERHPECASIAEQAYAQHVHEKTQPTEVELLQLLGHFIQATAATFYFLDALDEAPDRIQVDLVQKLASLNARLFITSRPLEAIQSRLSGAHCFSIAAQDGDLDLHIAQGIARSRDLATLLEKAGSALRNEIESLIKSKCGGMFLHASLQLEAVCECIDTEEVKQTLEVFPSRIEDVYLQTWKRIVEQKARHALTAKAFLVWVLNAAEPMTIEALRCAVAISPDTQKFEPHRLVPGKTLIALCHGLVTLEKSSKLVRLVHYTARDTLQGLLRGSFPHPHSHLVTVCMNHLAEYGFQNTVIRLEVDFYKTLDANPLLSYASKHWATHARQSLDSEEAKRRISTFIGESNAFPVFTNHDWHSDFDLFGPFHLLVLYDLPISLIPPHHIGDPNAASQIEGHHPLELAIWHANEVAFASLLAHPEIQVNVLDNKERSALILALERGHEGMAKLLLARPETKVNIMDSDGRSALILALQNGHEDIAKLLLARPETQASLVDSDGRSELILALQNVHEDIAKLLLARPETRINLVDGDGQSALIIATEKGYEGIVKLLLAHPEAQVNLVDRNGWSALIIAAENGWEGIVKLLLAHPETQVNLVDIDGRSALCIAAVEGQEGIVKLLLAHPEAQVNLVDSDGRSALCIAAVEGQEGIVKLLLARHDIQVKLADDEGSSTLIIAVLGGQEGIVKLLLARPETQVNLLDRSGWSALMGAAFNACEGIVKLLLACPETQVNLVDSNGRSALVIAAEGGQEGIVKLLLACPETQVNLVDRNGCSALVIAAKCGREGIVTLLLAHHDIQVNLADNEGCSSLMKVARCGYRGIFKLLLACDGIRVDLVDKDRWSALMMAAGNGHEGLVEQLLVRPEIEANLPNKNAWTALMLAARYGHEIVAKLLLACPDPMVNLANNNGWSALMLAAFHGHIGVVKLLLSRPETLVDSVDNEHGWSALMLATYSGHEAIVALLLSVAHIDTAARGATDGHTAMSFAVAKGHTGIVWLLEEFESRQARASSLDLTLHPSHPTPGEPIGDEAGIGSSEAYHGSEEWLAGDYVTGVGGADDILTQDEPSGSRRDAKRPRGDEDDGLQRSGDDIAAPTPKRQRVGGVAEDA